MSSPGVTAALTVGAFFTVYGVISAVTVNPEFEVEHRIEQIEGTRYTAEDAAQDWTQQHDLDAQQSAAIEALRLQIRAMEQEAVR